MPKFLSSDAKDIISKIFVTDPTKRITIDELKQHPWYKLHQPENQNYNCHKQSRDVNDKLVLKMESSLGFSVDSVRHAVQNNKHNHLSATYYLLLKKYAQINYKQSHRNYSVQSKHQASSHSNHLTNEERKSTVTNSDTKK
jgi:serine/threonine protein kinase